MPPFRQTKATHAAILTHQLNQRPWKGKTNEIGLISLVILAHCHLLSIMFYNILIDSKFSKHSERHLFIILSYLKILQAYMYCLAVDTN